MKIGIVGGTFDPFHRGHLDPVLAVRDTMQWDRLLYVPAWQQPFKSGRGTASGYHRFAMIVLGTESHDAIFVSPRELERGGVSYTVDTTFALRAEHADATLDWIIGDDNLATLTAWKDIDGILASVNFTVLTRHAERPIEAVPLPLRSRVTEPEMRPPNGAIVFAENRAVSVSSTEIRRRVRAGERIDELVDPRVARYIQHNRLYQEENS